MRSIPFPMNSLSDFTTVHQMVLVQEILRGLLSTVKKIAESLSLLQLAMSLVQVNLWIVKGRD